MSVLQLPVTPTAYSLTQLSVLEVAGVDSQKFLQGQLTCDVNALSVGSASRGAQCNPQGKMLSTFYLLVDHDAYYIVTDCNVVDVQQKELEKYAVFSQVEITRVDDIQVTGVAGIGSAQWMTEQDTHEIPYYAIILEEHRWLWISPEPIPQALPQGDEQDWWGFEILSGYPHLKTAGIGEFIPQMFNLQALDAVSFDKGCYTGQETVARAKYRGANNRALFILQGRTQVPIDSGHFLEKQLDSGWRRAGIVVNVWQKGQDVLLAAVLPIDTPMDQALRIKEDTGSHLQILPLPYTLDLDEE